MDTILPGDCVEIMNTLPAGCVDLVFADPPYNLQLHQELHRPNRSRVDGVDDGWDRFKSFEAYDQFTRSWLAACRHVMKDTATLWVIGTYHNIYRIGAVLQDLGYWILNDVIWVKTNPMPNFHGVRFTNAHETLIWACKQRQAHYTFNYQAMKALNDGLQMRSDWLLPICTGPERIKDKERKAHSTQKPEALLHRVLLAASNPGDVILDPFFGTGTSGAVAKRLHRRWIGIERDEKYVEIASQRIAAVEPLQDAEEIWRLPPTRQRSHRIPFGALLENGLVSAGQKLYLGEDGQRSATVLPEGRLLLPDGFIGSIHQAALHLSGNQPCNGWDMWFIPLPDGSLQSIDALRQEIRKRMAQDRG